jgi:hypothetical protein
VTIQAPAQGATKLKKPKAVDSSPKADPSPAPSRSASRKSSLVTPDAATSAVEPAAKREDAPSSAVTATEASVDSAGLKASPHAGRELEPKPAAAAAPSEPVVDAQPPSRLSPPKPVAATLNEADAVPAAPDTQHKKRASLQQAPVPEVDAPSMSEFEHVHAEDAEEDVEEARALAAEGDDVLDEPPEWRDRAGTVSTGRCGRQRRWRRRLQAGACADGCDDVDARGDTLDAHGGSGACLR